MAYVLELKSISQRSDDALTVRTRLRQESSLKSAKTLNPDILSNKDILFVSKQFTITVKRGGVEVK